MIQKIYLLPYINVLIACSGSGIRGTAQLAIRDATGSGDMSYGPHTRYVDDWDVWK